MPNPLPPLPQDKIATLAKLTGGLALLVGIAVLISSATFPHNAGLAAAVTAYSADPGYTLSISAPDSIVSPGASTQLTWSSVNEQIVTPPFNCFGKSVSEACYTLYGNITTGTVVNPTGDVFFVGTTTGTYLLLPTATTTKIFKWTTGAVATCGAVGTIGDGSSTCGINAPFQSLPITGVIGVRSFSFEYNNYLVTISTSTSASTNLYKWIPTGNSNKGCFGDMGGSCGTPLQSMSATGTNMEFFASSSNYFLVLSRSGSPLMYKWTGSCFGDAGTNCGSSSVYYQALTASPNASSTRYFTIGNANYLVVGTGGNHTTTVYKWSTGSGCPSSGGWGDGVACGSTKYIQNTLGWAKNMEVYTIDGDPNPYLANSTNNPFTDPNHIGAGGFIYKWNPSANSGKGCFNDGVSTTCGSYFNYIYQWIPGWVVDMNYYNDKKGNQFLTSATTHATDGYYSLMYKWTLYASGNGCPSSGGWGNGYDCESPTVHGAKAWWTTGEPMVRWRIFPIGANDTFILMVRTVGAYILRGVATPCFGNGIVCGIPYQRLSAGSVTSHTPKDWKVFTQPGDAANPYLALAVSNATTSPMYHWVPNKNCFGKDTASPCGTSFQDIPTSDAARFEVATTSSDTFLIAANASGTSSPMYQWLPSQNCYGTGTSCNVPYQSFRTDNASDALFFTFGANRFLAITNLNGTISNVYTWISSRSCFGSATNVCATATSSDITYGAFQSFNSTGGAMRWTRTVIGGSLYLILTLQTANGKVFKWMSASSCFGDGASTCGGIFQTIPVGNNDTRLLYPLTLSTTTSSTYTDTFLIAAMRGANHSYIYQWMPAGVPSVAVNPNGCFGNATSSCSTFFEDMQVSSAGATTGYQTWGAFATTTTGTTIDNYLLSSTDFNFSVYKWSLTKKCFGIDSVCGLGNYKVQVIPEKNIADVELFNLGQTPYMALPAPNNSASVVYKWTSFDNTYIPACTVYARDSSGTYPIASGDNPASAFDTGPITQDTDYSLKCFMTDGTTRSTNWITVQLARPTVDVSVTQSAAEPSTAGIFTVSTGYPVTSPLVVYFSTSTYPGPGTATSTHYALSTSTSVTIPTGSSTATIILSPLNAIATTTETVVVTLSSNSAYSLGASYFATMTMAYASGGTYFSPAAYSVAENATNTVITVHNSVAQWPVSIHYATQDGTAVAGQDYTATSGTLSWSDAGDQTFSIPITHVSGSNKNFTMQLSNPTGAPFVSPSTSTVTILEPAASATVNSFKATRVRSGQSSTLSWDIAGLISGITCSIAPSSKLIGTPAVSVAQGTKQTTAVTQSTIFILSCTNGIATTSVPATATLVPNFQEI
jgi:hypothetical protein